MSITRRSILKLLAMAPVIGRRSVPVQSSPVIPWQSFCGGSYRYDLQLPFVQDGYKFATNSRICVWQPDNNDSVNDDRKLPPIGNYVAEWSECDLDWSPYPDASYRLSEDPHLQECWCHQGRQFARDCVCDDWGCAKCGHTGEIPYGPHCTNCNGDYKHVERIIDVGEHQVDKQYDLLIRQCGPIAWAKVPLSASQHPGHNTPILVKCVDSLIAVMEIAK